MHVVRAAWANRDSYSADSTSLHAGDDSSLPRLTDAPADYLTFMRSHTVREEEVLFPMVDRLLS